MMLSLHLPVCPLLAYKSTIEGCTNFRFYCRLYCSHQNFYGLIVSFCGSACHSGCDNFHEDVLWLSRLGHSHWHLKQPNLVISVNLRYFTYVRINPVMRLDPVCQSNFLPKVRHRYLVFNWMAPWKNQICSTTMKLRKSLVKPVTRQKTCYYIKLFSSSIRDRHARRRI